MANAPKTPFAGHDCETCPAHAQLEQMGVTMSGWDHLVALAGNPNTGKSSVFNELTGLRQHVGNWTGKTVARAEGGYSLGGVRYKLVDLPGTYSLLSASEDEEKVPKLFDLLPNGDPTRAPGCHTKSCIEVRMYDEVVGGEKFEIGDIGGGDVFSRVGQETNEDGSTMFQYKVLFLNCEIIYLI